MLRRHFTSFSSIVRRAPVTLATTTTTSCLYATRSAATRVLLCAIPVPPPSAAAAAASTAVKRASEPATHSTSATNDNEQLTEVASFLQELQQRHLSFKEKLEQSQKELAVRRREEDEGAQQQQNDAAVDENDPLLLLQRGEHLLDMSDRIIKFMIPAPGQWRQPQTVATAKTSETSSNDNDENEALAQEQHDIELLMEMCADCLAGASDVADKLVLALPPDGPTVQNQSAAATLFAIRAFEQRAEFWKITGGTQWVAVCMHRVVDIADSQLRKLKELSKGRQEGERELMAILDRKRNECSRIAGEMHLVCGAAADSLKMLAIASEYYEPAALFLESQMKKPRRLRQVEELQEPSFIKYCATFVEILAAQAPAQLMNNRPRDAARLAKRGIEILILLCGESLTIGDPQAIQAAGPKTVDLWASLATVEGSSELQLRETDLDTVLQKVMKVHRVVKPIFVMEERSSSASASSNSRTQQLMQPQQKKKSALVDMQRLLIALHMVKGDVAGAVGFAEELLQYLPTPADGKAFGGRPPIALFLWARHLLSTPAGDSENNSSSDEERGEEAKRLLVEALRNKSIDEDRTLKEFIESTLKALEQD